MYIVVDFDNTLAIDRYPDVGEEVPGACAAIGALFRAGHILILSTARTGKPFDNAIRWMREEAMLYSFSALNQNHNDLIDKYGDTRKITGDIVIDDKAVGCPLIVWDGVKMVDWNAVRDLILGPGR